ncbi:MAG: hypothetical protein V8R85_10810 [Frisingicoccus sp.]
MIKIACIGLMAVFLALKLKRFSRNMPCDRDCGLYRPVWIFCV